MTLEDFPQFVVASFQVAGDKISLSGSLNNSQSVREGLSWLIRGEEYYVGELSELSQFEAEQKTAVFAAFKDELVSVQAGAAFFWLDGFWNADLVLYVGDKDSPWTRETFKVQDAQEFWQGNVRGCWKFLGKVPEGARPGRIIPGGWDHEHCSICEVSIDEGNVTYYRGGRHMLCEKCFKKYARRHDLSFAVFS